MCSMTLLLYGERSESRMLVNCVANYWVRLSRHHKKEMSLGVKETQVPLFKHVCRLQVSLIIRKTL